MEEEGKFLYSSESDSSHYKVSFPRPSHFRLVVMLTGPSRLALFPTPILVFSPEAFIFQTMEPIQLVAVNLERSAHCSCDDHTFWFAGDHHIVVVQSLSHIWLFATPGTAAHQASLSFTISQSLLKFMYIELMKPSNCKTQNLGLCSKEEKPRDPINGAQQMQHARGFIVGCATGWLRSPGRQSTPNSKLGKLFIDKKTILSAYYIRVTKWLVTCLQSNPIGTNFAGFCLNLKQFYWYKRRGLLFKLRISRKPKPKSRPPASPSPGSPA